MRMPIVPIFFLFALFLFTLTGCPVDHEPEERRAFITFLEGTVAARKEFPLPELTGEEKKAFGEYAGHYALLVSFQKTLSEEAGNNAEELLALAAFTDLEALAKGGDSLKKAAKEADALRKIVADLKTKTDRKKAKLSLPDDLAPVYNAVYDEIVSRPAAASVTLFSSVHAAVAAILDLLDFVGSRSRDMEIRGKNIDLKNTALKDELEAKMAAVRERTLELGKASSAMAQAMTP